MANAKPAGQGPHASTLPPKLITKPPPEKRLIAPPPKSAPLPCPEFPAPLPDLGPAGPLGFGSPEFYVAGVLKQHGQSEPKTTTGEKRPSEDLEGSAVPMAAAWDTAEDVDADDEEAKTPEKPLPDEITVERFDECLLKWVPHHFEELDGEDYEEADEDEEGEQVYLIPIGKQPDFANPVTTHAQSKAHEMKQLDQLVDAFKPPSRFQRNSRNMGGHP